MKAYGSPHCFECNHYHRHKPLSTCGVFPAHVPAKYFYGVESCDEFLEPPAGEPNPVNSLSADQNS